MDPTGLTCEPGRSSPQAAVLLALPVEQPVTDAADELVQFGSGRVDQFCPGSAQHGSVHPERQPSGHGGREGAREAEHPGGGEQDPLLSAGHGGGRAPGRAGEGGGGGPGGGTGYTHEHHTPMSQD